MPPTHSWNKQVSSRQEKTRKEQKIFFLFTEGEKTEPNYFKDIAKLYGTRIQFSNKKGSGATPGNLVKQAVKGINSGKIQGNSIELSDEVWCIFDRDAHTDISQAFLDSKTHNNSSNPKKKLKIAYTNECFEHWLLLHFNLCSSAILRHGSGGLFEKIGTKLSIHNYDESGKGTIGLFKKIIDKGGTMEKAIQHAKKVYKDAGYSSGYTKTELEQFTGDSIDYRKAPITTVHFLVLSMR